MQPAIRTLIALFIILPPFGNEQRPQSIPWRQAQAPVFFRDIFRTSVIEIFVEISTKNVSMIRDLEAVDQLVTAIV
jgi:hypothetical protein